ncbi:MAG: AAA family ATPase [Cyanobacteriota bacterium]
MLKERLKSHIESNNLKHNEVAKAIGYSETALSQWFNDSYKADTKGIDENIKAYLEREEARKSEIIKNPEYILTDAVKTIVETAKLCHLDKRMRVICGEAGVGKTTAVKQYSKNSNSVIVINSNITIRPKKLCRLFYEKLGYAGKATVGDMLDEIISRLRHSDRLIIVDEAEYLPYEALEIIRTIYNECQIGILLIGTPELYYNLKGQSNRHAMLWSRVTCATFLKKLTLKETESFVCQYFKGLEREVVVAFYALSGGNARTLVNIIVNTANIHNRTNKPVNPVMIKAAVDLSMKGQV